MESETSFVLHARSWGRGNRDANSTGHGDEPKHALIFTRDLFKSRAPRFRAEADGVDDRRATLLVIESSHFIGTLAGDLTISEEKDDIR